MRDETDTVVVGAGPAGLAVGACLRRAGVPFIMLERGDSVAASWRRHYDRLRLHTDKTSSALPFEGFPRSYPRYPTRMQMVDYLESYARHFDLAPLLDQNVLSVRPTDGAWVTGTAERTFVSRNVVLATGNTRRSYWPRWADAALYGGRLLHSADYRNGASFRGERVLVVGMGNSGAEIALDLHEHDARAAIAVRGPVSVIPRDICGVPIAALGVLLGRFPPRVADALAAPALWLTVGDLSRIGLPRPSYGPVRQIAQRGRIPLIDVGTIDLIRRDLVTLRPGVRRLTRRGVVFGDGAEEAFDAVILATGYRTGLEDILGARPDLLDADGTPRRDNERGWPSGLYLCGFTVAASGVLREIAREARAIAARIATFRRDRATSLN